MSFLTIMIANQEGWTGLAIGLSILPLVSLTVMIVLLVLMLRSFRSLQDETERLAKGDLCQRVSLQGPIRLTRVSDALNRMATELESRFQSINRHRTELEAVLSSMVEGVVVIDLNERIISVNQAAGRMLDADPASVSGRTIQEVVRNSGLQMFITQALHTDVALQDNLQMRAAPVGDPERDIELQSAPLREEGGRRRGVVIVLHDVSILRKLEGVRRDFVANVSHEIKTPVTAIKGFCETLLDGGEHNAEDSERFLRIIGRQAERLHAIVDDVLTLSRIEQDEKEDRIELQPARLAPVLIAAREACELNADARQITVHLECPTDLNMRINAPLLEQAVVNLLDNAIKYSPPGSEVTIKATQRNDMASIAVIDQGPGIAAEHLARLFERFYRTDRARSREMGGTGLGLAIVKHIAQAHGGTVDVRSEIGRGSTFILDLPLERTRAVSMAS